MPNKFTYRSDEKELLDESNIPQGLLYKNLHELDLLNRFTGGHAISLKGFRQLITDHQKSYHVVDLGCGSGDALKAIAGWARSNQFRVKLTGVDRNADAIEYLKINCANYPEISGVTADYQDYLHRNESIDIVHCSLFCHHLNDNDIFSLFTYFRQHVRMGFIINDLQRHWLAYGGAWFFTRMLNGTKLARNDGPVSVLRGFKPDELTGLLDKATIRNYILQKEWLFRLLIVGKSENHEGPER